MPIKVIDNLPAIKLLEQEQIFVMPQTRASQQDIRPLKILLLNLMPNKNETEIQLLRLLSNTPIQIELDLLTMSSHIPKNTPAEHLAQYYLTFNDIKNNYYDGLIVTGAPIEHLAFEQVDYWSELCQLLAWANYHVFANLFICWGAQAALNFYYQIPKYPLAEKMFGIFPHTLNPQAKSPLLRGLDDICYIPHSRHTENKIADINKYPDLQVLIESPQSGAYAIIDQRQRRVFLTGHIEYEQYTLDKEYKRDLALNKPIKIPENYYPNDDPSQPPIVNWRSGANILFSNWINYYVYQSTPYQLEKLATDGND